MQWFESIKRMQNLHELIKKESTGTPCELAYHFCLSRRQLYNIIEDLKIMGAVPMFVINMQTNKA